MCDRRLKLLFACMTGWFCTFSFIIADQSPFAFVTECYGFVVPIDLLTQTADTAISIGTNPQAIAITPDRTTAYVTCSGDDTVWPIDLATLTVGTAITVGGYPWGIAITPDGSMAYVANGDDGTVSPIHLATQTVGTAITVGTYPLEIAITYDGTMAYVTCYDSTVWPIDLVAQKAGTPLIVGPGPYDIAITPNGSTAYVTNSYTNTVSPIDLATQTVGTAITVGNEPRYIAITPDGTMAFVTNCYDRTVSPINLATQTAGTAIILGGKNLEGIAITPDGTMAYVCDNVLNGSVTLINLATLTPGTAISGMGQFPWDIAITPDQAPTASFTASYVGLTVTFDGSSSLSPWGTIAQYQWDFGDGAPTTTSSPSVSHVYQGSGTYTTSLTVVNSAGTSTDVTFAGKTVSNRGMPRALSTKTLLLRPPPPASFAGKVVINKKKGKVVLKTSWPFSADINTEKYLIFAHDTCVATVPSSTKSVTIRLHPHHVPKRVTKHYKRYLQKKYTIRSVNTESVIGPAVRIRVK